MSPQNMSSIIISVGLLGFLFCLCRAFRAHIRKSKNKSQEMINIINRLKKEKDVQRESFQILRISEPVEYKSAGKLFSNWLRKPVGGGFSWFVDAVNIALAKCERVVTAEVELENIPVSDLEDFEFWYDAHKKAVIEDHCMRTTMVMVHAKAQDSYVVIKVAPRMTKTFTQDLTPKYIHSVDLYISKKSPEPTKEKENVA